MERVRSADGTPIAFDRTGDGPPLLLVGGALADRSAAPPTASPLAERFTVFAIDRRGRGDSGDTPPYAVEREIEDVAAVVAVAGGSAFALGHSSGAVLTLRATAAGVSFTRLAAYEPPFIVDDSRPPLPDDYQERLNGFVGEGRLGDAVAYFLTAGVGLPPEAVDNMRSAPTWPRLETMAHTIGYDGLVMGDDMRGRPLDTDPWSGVSVPTLVIDGGASPAWQHAGADALATVLPDARRVTLDGQDHGPAPEVLVPVLIEFLSR